MKKERFDFMRGHYGSEHFASAEEHLRIMTNRLLQSLYIPHHEKEFVCDELRTGVFGVSKEPINWGDLKCCDVCDTGYGKYLITIDEASPNECPNLCEYVRSFLAAWGWNVEVITEW